MLLFLPEILSGVINVSYYETPEGFSDALSHPRKKIIKTLSNVCSLLFEFFREV